MHDVCAAFVGGSAPENVITYMKTLDGTVHTIPMQLFKTDELTEGAGYRFNLRERLCFHLTKAELLQSTAPGRVFHRLGRSGRGIHL